ncbi:MAG: energy-coupling factor transporter transmembrane component T [Clostridia bacterium]|nr:energy-coupling factor transporter transmembrane component T [Clostridia bacterium]
MESKRESVFSGYHPAVSFTFFAAVIVFSMLFMHPLFLAAGLASAFLYSIVLSGAKAAKYDFALALPALLLLGLINPLFSHRGATVLLYLGDTPVTLESIAYGAAAAAMLITVIVWFSCYSTVVTSDKFIYLFSRVIPTTALIVTMALGLIPRLKRQAGVIAASQKTLGLENGTAAQRVRFGLRTVSVLIGWTLESAIDTADSMKARGYGLRGRSAFSLYRFDSRDARALAVLLTLIALCLAGLCSGGAGFAYYPQLQAPRLTVPLIASLAAYLLLALFPTVIEIQGEWSWRLSR